MIAKFRGWHKELEQMIYGKEICGHIEYTTNLVDALNTMLNEDDYGIELMQSTGMKDKNGVEIFGGDILDESFTSPLNGKKIIVIYTVKLENGMWRLKDYQGRQQFDRYLFLRNQQCEVVGNVWENPELLEVAE